MEQVSSLPPSKAVFRAMRMAKRVLEEQGYEIVPFQITEQEMDEIRSIYVALMTNYFGRMWMNIHQKKYGKPLPYYSTAFFII